MVRFLNRFRTKSAECVQVVPNRLNLYKYSTKSAYSIEVEPNQQEMEDLRTVESLEYIPDQVEDENVLPQSYLHDHNFFLPEVVLKVEADKPVPLFLEPLQVHVEDAFDGAHLVRVHSLDRSVAMRTELVNLRGPLAVVNLSDDRLEVVNG